MKILLIGGHISPLLAVLEELKKHDSVHVEFVSRRHTMEGDKTPSQESKILETFGYPIHFVKTGRLQRNFSPHTLLSLLKVPFGFLQAFRILSEVKPGIVVSFGSYLSVPVVIAAWLQKIPVITHEQSVHAGLASKINALFAKRVLVSWENSLQYFPKGKTVVTGNPIRKEIFQTKAESKEIAQFLSQATLPIL